MNNVKVDAVKIGSHIVKLRKEQHLTQEELGRKIHISSTHISTVENGGSYSLNTLISICDGLNTSSTMFCTVKSGTITRII